MKTDRFPPWTGRPTAIYNDRRALIPDHIREAIEAIRRKIELEVARREPVVPGDTTLPNQYKKGT